MIEGLFEEGPLHFTLIDPDEQGPGEAGEIAAAAQRGGSSAVMVGGSVGSGPGLVRETVGEIKDNAELPVLLFPPDHGSVVPNADAVLFMSMLNSRNPMYIAGFQMMGAPMVKRFGLEALPMAYLPVEPAGSSSVGYVSDCRPIPRAKADIAVAYSLAAQFMGMEYVYLEGGSGVDDPVPLEMVRAVVEETDLTLLVGGGISSPRRATERVSAGADVVVTGTAVEDAGEVESTIAEFVQAL